MRSFTSNTAARAASAGILLSAACSAAALAGEPCSCLGDLNFDGVVDGADITGVLGAWGTGDPAADLDDNGIVNGGDITVLLGSWGECTAPANDNCANAKVVSPGTYDFCNSSASTDGPSLPSNSCGFASNVNNDVWFRFAPLSDGVLKVTTCGSDFDTVLAIYSSTIEGLSSCPTEGIGLATYLGCSDDQQSEGLFCGDLNSSVTLNVLAGYIYKIRVGGYDPFDIGNGTLHVEFTSEGSSCATPITTNFNNHQVIVGNTSDNPVDPTVPTDCFGTSWPQGPMEWITFTNTCNGILTLSTCNPGTDYDTVITVLRYEFDGNCWSTFIECNDDFDGDPDCHLFGGFFLKSQLQVPTSPGEVFKIVVSGWNGQSGNYELTIDRDCN